MTRLTKTLIVAGLVVIAWALVLHPFALRFADRDVDQVLAVVGVALLYAAAVSEFISGFQRWTWDLTPLVLALSGVLGLTLGTLS